MLRLSVFDSWYTRLFSYQKDTPELILRKKFFLVTNVIAIIIFSCVTFLAYFMELRNLAWHILLLLGFTLAQTILLIIIRKWSRWFVYTVFSTYIALIFCIIISLGGFASSAGLLMVAYFFLLTAQWMEDTRLLIFVGILYVIGVLVTGISFPWLQPDETLTGWKNNLFFAINYGWIGIVIALALYSTIVKGENAAKSRARQLQELDLLKSKLYANIAHEFRTPLTLIKGNAEDIGDAHEGEIAERAKSIVRNSDKILFLVNQMLNLSKVEEGGIPVHYVQSDLVAFLQSIVVSFREYANQRKLELHYEPGFPALMMDIDPEKLEESVSNLLSNAIKYTPEGGEVFVSLRLPGQGQTPDQHVEISIRDTGIGISEDQLDKIFIRFYRVEDKEFPYCEGTGIGLTIVQEYLRMMNGSIRVTSIPGEGSEFVITLPVTHDAPVENEIRARGDFSRIEKHVLPASGKIVHGPGLPRILVVEDNMELIEYLKSLLGSEYNVLTAEDGISGVEQAVTHIPDIILCDVMMPGKDGYQVCRELKRDFRTNHIPVVMLTARADSDSRITGLECGADAYLIKPFDKKELMACLHQLYVQREKLRLKYQAKLYEPIPEELSGVENIKFLNKVLDLLEQNYRNERYHIEDLFRHLGISRVQLHRKLTALTGLPASNFIRSFRLHKARTLLLETDRNVSEIAREVGFADPNYFTRAFVQEHGITPKEMRKSLV